MRKNRLREGGGGRGVYDGPKVRGGVGRSYEVGRWSGGVEKAFTAGKESAGEGHACGGFEARSILGLMQILPTSRAVTGVLP